MEKISGRAAIAYAVAAVMALGLVTWGFAEFTGAIDKDSAGAASGGMMIEQSFGGVGLEISKEDGALVVVKALDGSPAARAGIQAGDRIVRVNDEAVEEDPDLPQIVQTLRGKPGTEVSITVKRGDELKTFTFSRGEIKVQMPQAITPGGNVILQPGPSETVCPKCGYRWKTDRTWGLGIGWPFGGQLGPMDRSHRETLEQYEKALRSLRDARSKLWRTVPQPGLPKGFEAFKVPFGMVGPPDAEGDLRMDMDVRETDEAITIRCDMPGMKKDDIDIRLKGNMLTIQGTRRTEEETKDEQGKIVRKERSFGSFSRSFTVPGDVKSENIKTSYEDGVLTIVIPKEAPKPQEEKAIKINIDTI